MTSMRELAAIVLFLLLGAAGAVAAEAGPGDAALVAAGFRHWEAGRVEEAAKSFEQAIAVNPRSVEAHMKLGGLLLTSNRYAEAIRTYQRLISFDADNARAWIALGLAYRHAGQPELSRAAFGEAVRIEPARKTQLAGLLESPTK
jgi:tetratricopeptide (TPR) repeat protein